MTASKVVDVVVVGGGLAGLAAAATVAKAGLSVRVLERSRETGGRARTSVEDAVLFNLGPHALYKGGRGLAVLRGLGVEPSGHEPATSGALLVRDGVPHALPTGLLSLIGTSAIPLSSKLDAIRGFAALTTTADAAALAATTVDEWLARAVSTAPVRDLLRTIVRLSTYCDDGRQSAGAALEQVRSAFKDNVLYLDGGWTTIVESLEKVVIEAGGEITRSAPVVAIEHGPSVQGVRLASGGRIACAAVVIAASPSVAHELASSVPALAGWARDAQPVEAACLDVALEGKERERAGFALGLDAPLYFSVHSRAAKLGPEGIEVIHVAKYGHGDEAELERFLDLLRPGWRTRVRARRFMPRLVVANALVDAARGGLAGRPGPEVPGVRGLLVAGDWVGAEGMLADASLASGRAAALSALEVARASLAAV